jgi:pantoate--beta-alanine ligase
MLVTDSIPHLQSALLYMQPSLGFVPTMGALHAGHIALVRAAKAVCQHVVVSIFVNPLQFGPNEDLTAYPRPLQEDLALLKAEGVNAVFTPNAATLYPDGFRTQVQVRDLGTMLCGAHRIGHFDGVSTVVTLLLSLVRPSTAFFGEKDFQQLAIIKQLNKDLRLVDAIVGVPTMRENDGLALSSRNRYLNAEERSLAPLLHQTLQTLRSTASEMIAAAQLQESRHQLEQHGFVIDYLELRDATHLQATERKAGARLFVAARLGKTRLIDNVAAV